VYSRRSSIEGFISPQEKQRLEKSLVIIFITRLGNEVSRIVPHDRRFGSSRRPRDESVVTIWLNAASQRSEIAHPLQLVVWQLDVKMMFQSRQQVEGLQAVNANVLKMSSSGPSLSRGTLKMGAARVRISSRFDQPLAYFSPFSIYRDSLLTRSRQVRLAPPVLSTNFFSPA